MTFPRNFSSCVLSGCVVLTFVAGNVLAQQEEQLGVPTDLEKFKDSQFQFYRSLSGGSAPTADEKKMYDLAARYFVYRVTWLDHVNDPYKMERAVREFEVLCRDRVVRDKRVHKDTREYFTKQILKCLKQTLTRDFIENRLSSTNAAQMLPMIAQTKSEEASDLLVELLADPKMHNVIKLYAVKGLREYFPAKVFQKLDLLGEIGKKAKEKEVRRAQVLIDYLSDSSWTKMSDPMELKAVAFIRKEAVETLAMAQIPAVTALKDLGKVEAPIAAGLISVLSDTELKPRPSLREKIEAAIGVCNIDYKYMQEYEPMLGVVAVARFSSEFIDGYRADVQNFKRKRAAFGQANAADDQTLPFLPWKIHTARLKESLDTLVKNTRNHPEALKLATELQQRMTPFLNDIYQYRDLSNQNSVDYRTWSKELKAPTGAMFKNLKSPKISLGK